MIREREPADLPKCVAVLGEVHRTDDYPLRWPADPAGWLSPPQLLHAWVAVAGAEVAGHVTVCQTTATTFEISRLFVAPATRGSGLGSKLLSHARGWAASHGFGLELEIVDAPRSAPAIALYERTGWQHTGTTTATWTATDGRPVRLRRYALQA